MGFIITTVLLLSCGYIEIAGSDNEGHGSEQETIFVSQDACKSGDNTKFTHTIDGKKFQGDQLCSEASRILADKKSVLKFIRLDRTNLAPISWVDEEKLMRFCFSSNLEFQIQSPTSHARGLIIDGKGNVTVNPGATLEVEMRGKLGDDIWHVEGKKIHGTNVSKYVHRLIKCSPYRCNAIRITIPKGYSDRSTREVIAELDEICYCYPFLLFRITMARMESSRKQ